MSDVEQALDELLEKKLKTPEGRRKLASFAASYCRDQIRANTLSDVQRMMLGRVAKILDACAAESATEGRADE